MERIRDELWKAFHSSWGKWQLLIIAVIRQINFCNLLMGTVFVILTNTENHSGLKTVLGTELYQ